MRLLALLAAAAAAALLPYAPIGVNVPIVAALVLAAVIAAAPLTLDRAIFGSLALALALMPALRDAGWVAALDLVAACVLSAFAVAGPRLAALFAPVRALDGVAALVPPALTGATAAVRGVALGTVLVVPFGALFWSADAAFAELGSSVLPSVEGLPTRFVVFVLVLFAALSLALAAGRVFADPSLPRPTVVFVEWAFALILLNTLFVAFVAVQVTVLFGGHDHVLETAGLTYAEYAREGFWQLLAAASLTLVVVGATVRSAEVRLPSQRAVRSVLLGALCVQTMVVVASALHRLHLYEDAFGLTRNRLAAETLSLGLGALFVLILLAGVVTGIRRQFARIATAAVALGLLAFSLSNPDSRVAERNVDRWRATGDLDITYLAGLSADAVPALSTLPEPLRQLALAQQRARLAEDEPWTSANLSRHRAREALGD
jgi:Domain of unknown function (DUF4173)